MNHSCVTEIKLAKPVAQTDFAPVSLADLKKAVDELTPEERIDLAEYARWRARQDDPAWRAELASRLDQAAAGQGHAREELLQMHDKLSSEGK